MSPSLATVVAVIALPAVVLVAWGMWLAFAALIAKWHGVDGLKAIRHVSDGFHPRDWALLIPRQSLASALNLLSNLRGTPTGPPESPRDTANSTTTEVGPGPSPANDAVERPEAGGSP